MISPIETPSVSPWMTDADERAHRRRVARGRACSSSASLVDEAHALLLQREPQLVAQRPVEPLGGHPQRAAEADAGLDRHHEQVDQLGQLVVDLVPGAARARLRRTSIGAHPADHAPAQIGRARSQRGDGRRRRAARAARRQAAPPRARGSRGSVAASSVHAGRHQARAHARPREQLLEPRGRRVADRASRGASSERLRADRRRAVAGRLAGEAVGVDLRRRAPRPATRRARSRARRVPSRGRAADEPRMSSSDHGLPQTLMSTIRLMTSEPAITSAAGDDEQQLPRARVEERADVVGVDQRDRDQQPDRQER